MTATTCDIVGVWHGVPSTSRRRKAISCRRPQDARRLEQGAAVPRARRRRPWSGRRHPSGPDRGGDRALRHPPGRSPSARVRRRPGVVRRAGRAAVRRLVQRLARRRTRPGGGSHRQGGGGRTDHRWVAADGRPGGGCRMRRPVLVDRPAPRQRPSGRGRQRLVVQRRSQADRMVVAALCGVLRAAPGVPGAGLRASCGLRQLIAFLRRDVLGTPCQTPTMSHVVAVMPVPAPHAYPQVEIASVIGPILVRDPTRRSLLERLHAASGVARRTLALPLAEYATLRDFGTANEAFVRVGTDLGEQAVRGALERAGLAPSEVDFLLFTTVTGVSAPSLDALLVEPLGLRPDVRRLPSFGLGCAGGAAGLARVHDYLLGHPTHVAVLLSVELCSLTIQHGDDSTANLVASGLFGDGAAAAVLVGSDHPLAPGSGPRVVDAASRLYPGTEDSLGWAVGRSGLRIVLSAGLPDLVASRLGDDVAGLE